MKRILRVLEYTGTDEFIRRCIDGRQVKGTMVRVHGTIREAILGDTAEILTKGMKEALDPKFYNVDVSLSVEDIQREKQA